MNNKIIAIILLASIVGYAQPKAEKIERWYTSDKKVKQPEEQKKVTEDPESDAGFKEVTLGRNISTAEQTELPFSVAHAKEWNDIREDLLKIKAQAKALGKPNPDDTPEIKKKHEDLRNQVKANFLKLYKIYKIYKPAA